MTSLRSSFAWMLFAVVIAACLALFVNVQASYFALLFAAVGWWSWQCPEEALLFFIMLSPLLPMFKITQTMANFTLAKDMLIAVLFIKQFFIPLITQRLPYRRNIFLWPILVLLAWVAVGVMRADSLTLGILRAREIGLYILLYLGVLYLPTNQQILYRRVRWFLVGLGGLLVLALYQWFLAPDGAVLRFDPVRHIWIPRISSTFAHPTVFGEYLNLAIAFFTGLLLTTKTKKWRTLSVLGICLLLPFIYLTYSRGVWLGLLATWVTVALSVLAGKVNPKGSWKRIFGGAVAFVLVIFLIVMFTPVGTFVRSALDPTYASNQIRLQFVNRLIASTSNGEALIGKGLGDVVQQTFRTADVSGENIVSGDSRSIQLSKDNTLVDNQYLKTFIEMGLVGLLIYGWIYAVIMKYVWRSKTIVGIMMIGFLSAFVVQALFVDIWDVFPTNALFWILAATLSVTLVPMHADKPTID